MLDIDRKDWINMTSVSKMNVYVKPWLSLAFKAFLKHFYPDLYPSSPGPRLLLTLMSLTQAWAPFKLSSSISTSFSRQATAWASNCTKLNFLLYFSCSCKRQLLFRHETTYVWEKIRTGQGLIHFNRLISLFSSRS